MSDEERAKRGVRDYVDAFNRGDMDALRALLADEAEIRGVLGMGMFERIEPIWRQLIDGYGMQLEIEDLVAEDYRVAARDEDHEQTGTRRVAGRR